MTPSTAAWAAAGRWPFGNMVPYLASFGFVAVAAGVAKLSMSVATAPSLTLIFLVAVIVSAQRFGLWPAVLSSLLSVLCWDYYFTLPYYSLELDDPRDVFALIAFLALSLIISGLTARIRNQNERLSALAASIAAAYRQSQEFARMATVEEAASFAASRISESLKSEAVVLLNDPGDGSSRLIFPPGTELSADEITASDSVFSQLSVTNRLGGPGSRGRYSFLPLNALRGRIGSVGVARPDAPELSAEDRQKLDAVISQAAVAVERAWLARDIEYARMIADSERLRSALLTSVSHDLRTPLTTIIGALSTLKIMGESFSPAIHAELLSTARDEALRLNRFIGNLLDITRLESGSLTAKLAPTDISEVVETVLERAEPFLAKHKVDVHLPADLPPASADYALLEQVLFNVIDNAVKYSPPHSTVEIRGLSPEDAVILEIADEGAGIPAQAREKIFEKFTRLGYGDSMAAGTGLGLMIARGFLKVMHGTIAAANRKDGRGAVFTIRLNRAPAPVRDGV